jgi:hypothetical protein
VLEGTLHRQTTKEMSLKCTSKDSPTRTGEGGLLNAAIGTTLQRGDGEMQFCLKKEDRSRKSAVYYFFYFLRVEEGLILREYRTMGEQGDRGIQGVISRGK